MRTIELWKCLGCSKPCYTDDPDNHDCNNFHGSWEKITATIQEQPNPGGPRLEDLKFGDEIEVGYEGEWSEAKPFINIYECKVGVLLNAYDTVITYFSEWRFPLKNKMMRGQPVIVWDEKSKVFTPDYHLFHNFNGDGQILVHVLGEKPDSYNNWRLPTAQELKDIGHDGMINERGEKWLTSD